MAIDDYYECNLLYLHPVIVGGDSEDKWKRFGRLAERALTTFMYFMPKIRNWTILTYTCCLKTDNSIIFSTKTLNIPLMKI